MCLLFFMFGSVDLDEDKGDNWDWVVRDDLN